MRLFVAQFSSKGTKRSKREGIPVHALLRRRRIRNAKLTTRMTKRNIYCIITLHIAEMYRTVPIYYGSIVYKDIVCPI